MNYAASQRNSSEPTGHEYLMVISRYRMGQVLVMFDLPVGDAEERRAASGFRKQLLDSGYQMLQESVYIRNCVTYERSTRYIDKVRKIAPPGGIVTVMYITNRQWLESAHITKGYKSSTKYAVDLGQNPGQQMKLW